ncbi:MULTISPECIES: TfuA-like protein [Cysteiniphilum]|uniref:TfuA-like protein n=1 Tax=Cysteiniphilum TaxID=2056696 RepID=UPI0017834735|nr:MULTISPECIES: TfuA-like protein [Cysteiniphilum]
MLDLTKLQIDIFAETSITHAEIKTHLPHARLHTSAKTGDILRVIPESNIIILIDGNFDFTNSIWHKEILCALEKGITVIGASSMGALRAAELDVFGMIGFGFAYECYKNNITDDDSEVAINYYRLGDEMIQTIPSINIRATCDTLIDNKLCTQQAAHELFNSAHNIFYKRRTWQALQSTLTADAFNLLKTYYVNAKYNDAYQCITQLADMINKAKAQEITSFTTPSTIPLNKLKQDTFCSDEFAALLFILQKMQKMQNKDHLKDSSLNVSHEAQELSKLTQWSINICEFALCQLKHTGIALTDLGFMRSLNIIRLNLELNDGEVFKQWCIDKKLDMSLVETTFRNLLLIKRLANAYACEHQLNYGF